MEFVTETLEKGNYPIIRKNQSARKNGQFYVCNCCYDEEVKPRDLGTCENGCVFCKSCIQRSVEIVYGQGKLVFPCLLDCSFDFSMQTLEDILPRKFYEKISQKKQIEEIKAAQIENLEICPFCDFAMIPVQDDKIFRCQNSQCLKETCRLCKKITHLPLRCDETSKPDEIQKRIYIENKMSEALIRICYKCGLNFIKSEGCNRMKCSCGAMMCYLCSKPVIDYTHFNGPGGDKYHLCPLFSDTDELHQQNIEEGMEKAEFDILLNKHISVNVNTT
ncbi:ubiquitin conjugating enzyme 7 interacting protein-related [Holotrichia oblita]|uniref:Ubiquitin conjugating enzyme 7 interacting protein-related n=1 Tax=Holotrichia oblita TaxID=644536 RepID=A0ACB9TV97_HOLOL|nr:ubiquitin conjugating enzyme 7 interacting protein-related [Holotrichia oblita]